MTLIADRIVDVALDLLNKEGLSKLSTRRLAKVLDMQGPSLYHHFRNKAELLGHMAAVMLHRTIAPLDQDVGWDTWLRTMAHATRAMTLGCRDGAQLLAMSYPTEEMQKELLPKVAQPLLAAGFSPRVANETSAFVAAFVIGWTINEQNERIRDYMGNVMDTSEAFSNGVETLVIGISVRTGKPLSISGNGKTR